MGCEPEVPDFGIELDVKKNILGFEVSVKYPQAVEVGYTRKNTPKYVFRGIVIEFFVVFYVIKQLSVRTVLLYLVGNPFYLPIRGFRLVVFHETYLSHDIRVERGLLDLELLLELGQNPSRQSQIFLEDLQKHVFRELGFYPD